MKITKTWFKKEIEISADEVLKLEKAVSPDITPLFDILNFIKYLTNTK